MRCINTTRTDHGSPIPVIQFRIKIFKWSTRSGQLGRKLLDASPMQIAIGFGVKRNLRSTNASPEY